MKKIQVLILSMVLFALTTHAQNYFVSNDVRCIFLTSEKGFDVFTTISLETDSISLNIPVKIGDTTSINYYPDLISHPFVYKKGTRKNNVIRLEPTVSYGFDIDGAIRMVDYALFDTINCELNIKMKESGKLLLSFH